ncbi:MAG: hypothetical protein AAF353_02325 [Pseudomonadota bacterium]
MSNELLKKKMRVRMTFAICWTFAGTYLYLYPVDDPSWFIQNGWWLCFIIGFINLVQMNFLTRKIKSGTSADSD